MTAFVWRSRFVASSSVVTAKTSTPKAAATTSASKALPTTRRAESDLGPRLLEATIVLEQRDRGIAQLVGVERLGDEAVCAGLDCRVVRM